MQPNQDEADRLLPTQRPDVALPAEIGRVDDEVRAPAENILPVVKKSVTLEIDSDEFEREFAELVKNDPQLHRIHRPPEWWEKERSDKIAACKADITRIKIERHRLKIEMKRIARLRIELQGKIAAKRKQKKNLNTRKYKPMKKMVREQEKRHRMLRKLLLAKMEVQALKAFRAKTTLGILKTPKV